MLYPGKDKYYLNSQVEVVPLHYLLDLLKYRAVIAA
ncbi:hypothetical protein REIS_0215 [Rickettsia endosymbiont of Ixodes scapularis]|nr:hypothetical protein REIS_0215 [Rickettsia endosymbiont of Ixodes scapularis]